MVLVLADDIISFLCNIIRKMNIDDFDGYHGYRLFGNIIHEMKRLNKRICHHMIMITKCNDDKQKKYYLYAVIESSLDHMYEELNELLTEMDKRIELYETDKVPIDNHLVSTMKTSIDDVKKALYESEKTGIISLMSKERQKYGSYNFSEVTRMLMDAHYFSRISF